MKTAAVPSILVFSGVAFSGVKTEAQQSVGRWYGWAILGNDRSPASMPRRKPFCKGFAITPAGLKVRTL